ncbi:hypothetical protein PUNSTDRAFT_71750 [Punctularia strigosozonata HHB-11173 SS5]|uniref:uncharacterized protein n=1 Tax=Punctularia strigosozonata (strain HHB-11173) TaxID=741275 RepID=UPI0004416F33|nr:uncharacterized protein PUNSTDRAFT_71750 [Punctularia strigosozonata HHB-11173 SS5]EIN07412.1 hypothetical protein PUNSTDRAFT_71750 [Punctularia strigosozonata HHB-11173 SS5]
MRSDSWSPSSQQITSRLPFPRPSSCTVCVNAACQYFPRPFRRCILIPDTRSVQNQYRRCGHAIDLVAQAPCDDRFCKFSPAHPPTCQPPSCLQTCWQ